MTAHYPEPSGVGFDHFGQLVLGWAESVVGGRPLAEPHLLFALILV